jgi:hypothetical protein
MAVPELLFIGGQAFVHLLTDDVFNAHDFGVLAVTVKNYALVEVFIEDGTIVMGLHLAFHVAVVEVEAVHVDIQSRKRLFALKHRRACFECACFGGLVAAGGLHI